MASSEGTGGTNSRGGRRRQREGPAAAVPLHMDKATKRGTRVQSVPLRTDGRAHRTRGTAAATEGDAREDGGTSAGDVADATDIRTTDRDDDERLRLLPCGAVKRVFM